MELQNYSRNGTRYYRKGGREDPPFEKKRRKTIVFEITLLQAFFLAVIFFAGFGWMFSLGITLGKQFPADESRLSLLQKLALALGYDNTKKDTLASKTNGGKTSSPAEIQLNLTYHEELSKPLPYSISSNPPSKTRSDTTQKQQRKEPPQTQQTLSSSSSSPPPPRDDTKEPAKPEMNPTTTVENTGEKYTVLVASFKSSDNAGRLEQMLKSKGYVVSRQETVIRNETWYRVMVGNFDSRDSAVRFMAMFNEKEGLKGVVVRK